MYEDIGYSLELLKKTCHQIIWALVSIGVFDISISHINCKYNDTFLKISISIMIRSLLKVSISISINTFLKISISIMGI